MYAPSAFDSQGRPIPRSIDTSLCDHVAHPDYVLACLKRADTVHVISSLCGVQALMYGKLVYTYGRPFYAGWGLTKDAEVFADRTNRRTLTELLSVALILGPIYGDWQNMTIGTPEETARRLLNSRNLASSSGTPDHLLGHRTLIGRNSSVDWRRIRTFCRGLSIGKIIKKSG